MIKLNSYQYTVILVIISFVLIKYVKTDKQLCE